MSAYGLNKRVTLQAKAAGVDATGAPLTGWTDVVEVWARIEDQTGRQYMAAKAGQNAVTTTIRIRAREGVLPAMRVMYGSDLYDIEAVLHREGVWIDLMTTRGASNG